MTVLRKKNVLGQLTKAETTGGSTYATQTWTYNGLGQMTRQTIAGQVDIEYRFSATQNDGRITHRKDWISGEEVAYLYDTLGRMTSASTTGPEWGQSFVFDGFGNLTQQVVTKGSAPAMSMTVNAANNRLTGTGISYDAAGNLLSDSVRTYWYDVFGRLGGTAGETYVYGPRNERVLINKANGTRELNIYGIDGLLYAVWSWNGTAWSRVTSKERIYFAGRLIMVGGEKVVTDRLGSVVRKGTQNMAYYPYGQERTSTANDTVKFGTYTRDSATGLDYAMNRYYQSSWGRFTTADPYRASGGPADPGSWNRYVYVGGDPVNYGDSSGLMMAAPYPPGYCPAEYTYTECYGYGGFGYASTGEWGGGGGATLGGPLGLPWGWLLPIFLPSPKAPGPEPEPECFAQLKYRSIDHPAQYAGATHAFWWVQDSTGQRYIITAGPENYEGDSTTYLRTWVVPGDDAGRGNNSSQKVAWSSGLSSIFCDEVAKMLQVASSFPNRGLTYDPFWGPNSNSAAHYFGMAAGFDASAPPGSYGWDTGIIYPGMPRTP